MRAANHGQTFGDYADQLEALARREHVALFGTPELFRRQDSAPPPPKKRRKPARRARQEQPIAAAPPPPRRQLIEERAAAPPMVPAEIAGRPAIGHETRPARSRPLKKRSTTPAVAPAVTSPEPVPAHARPAESPAPPARSSSSEPLPPPRRSRRTRTHAILGDAQVLRCRREDCGAVVLLAKATQHLWDAHRVAAGHYDRAKYFTGVAG